jgi:hypothetical protein
VELVRVHDQRLFPGVGQVVGRRQRKALPDHIVSGEADPSVVRGEPADHEGEPRRPQQFMAEHAVPDVARVVEAARVVVQAIHADVVQQAAGPHQVGINAGGTVATGVDVAGAGGGEELLGDPADDLAVRVHEVQRLRRRGEPLVQGEDFGVGGEVVHGGLQLNRADA